MYFALTGAGLTTWTARIPEIKQAPGLDDGQVTPALFSVAAGSVLAMQVAGWLADRVGSERVLGLAGVLLSASPLVPGFAGSRPALVGGLLAFGAGHGTVDVSMNVQALLVQRQTGDRS